MDAVVDSDHVNVTVAPPCLVLMDEFQFLQPNYVVRTLGEMRAITCLLDHCPSWLIEAARKALVDLVGGVVNASLQREAIVRPLF